MIHLEMSTLIYQPLAEVFGFVATPENDLQWQYGTLATARLSDGEITTGTRFRSVGHLFGRRNVAVFEVTAYELNEAFGFKSINGPLHLWSAYIFAMTPSGTRITIDTRAHVANLFHLDEGILEYRIKKQWKENLGMLKDLLEEKVFSFEPYPFVGEVGIF